MNFKDKVGLSGRVEIFVTKGKPPVIPGKVNEKIKNPPGYPVIYEDAIIDFSNHLIIHQEVIENKIVNIGKDSVIKSLSTGFIKVIARMAMGDRGTLPSDPTVPKTPTGSMSALFNEVYRADVDVTTMNTGTPTEHSIKFIKTFSAVEIPITAFSNQAKPVANEVGLIIADLLSGAPLPRLPVSAPSLPLSDEELFAIRTFKSVPFEIANEIAITIRYTIYIQE